MPPTTTDPVVIDDLIASQARICLRDVLSFRNVKALICWDLVDKYSWLLPKGLKRPLPFGDDYQSKSFATEISNALEYRSTR